jgi:hypothetical protein
MAINKFTKATPQMCVCRNDIPGQQMSYCQEVTDPTGTPIMGLSFDWQTCVNSGNCTGPFHCTACHDVCGDGQFESGRGGHGKPLGNKKPVNR